MCVEGKQTVQIITAPCKFNTVSPVVKHERADNSDLCRKISDKPNCSSKDDLSLQSMDVSNEEIPNTLSATENLGAEKYDTSTFESNMIQQLQYVSWKYKNPYSISISNHMNYGKSTHALENVLKEDEPQEGRAKRSILSNCREYLATYQESCGTPRTEYSFAALIVVMAQATARSLLGLIYIILNVAPVIQMFSFILRFVLDKIIDIRKTKNFQQVMVKLTIFVVQLLGVYVCLIFILGFIVLPIVHMAVGIATKFVMRN
ncbi:PREDICTED: uncharacterized protein LOC105456266 [Wasmannia auropunctata]|uniref:uncharacterized protein LOC105456266 n=1 Tax=Wasmannia auropunctata TaxID=64793 RepID=UPI0005EF9C5B|nr:PREDICTED: uncharacterized protein LOC105456266 [Wasmannia auropunctata]